MGRFLFDNPCEGKITMTWFKERKKVGAKRETKILRQYVWKDIAVTNRKSGKKQT